MDGLGGTVFWCFPVTAGGETNGSTVMKLKVIACLASLSIPLLAACGGSPEPEKLAPSEFDAGLFGQRSEAHAWTTSALAALDAHGTPLVKTVPADIDTYCPGYRDAGVEGRKAFWVTFLSALAKHESTWRPEVSGGGGAWHGLLQISPATARGYGCNAQSADALRDVSGNLSCGIRIMASTVSRDGVISAGMGGVAADWGPFHDASKRADIQARTRSAPVCRG